MTGGEGQLRDLAIRVIVVTMRKPRTPVGANWLVAGGLVAVLVFVMPMTTLAQTTTAAPDGWAYGFQVQLWHYDPVARQNVIGDVKQAGFTG